MKLWGVFYFLKYYGQIGGGKHFPIRIWIVPQAGFLYHSLYWITLSYMYTVHTKSNINSLTWNISPVLSRKSTVSWDLSPLCALHFQFRKWLHIREIHAFLHFRMFEYKTMSIQTFVNSFRICVFHWPIAVQDIAESNLDFAMKSRRSL